MITDLEILKRDLIVIENIENFKVKIPNYHPDHPQYNKIWKEYTKYCIEGLWVYDNGGWRFMPPTLFFYGNFFKIENTDRNKKVRTFVKPSIRDLDWLIHYSYMEAQGFSGFKDDDEITCDSAILDKEQYEELEKSEDESSRIRFADLHNEKGYKKQHEGARAYLKRTHKESFGRPLYYNRAWNLTLLGSRGEHRCPVN